MISTRHNSKKRTWFHRSSINKDIIIQPPQVENDPPPHIHTHTEFLN